MRVPVCVCHSVCACVGVVCLCVCLSMCVVVLVHGVSHGVCRVISGPGGAREKERGRVIDT